MKFSFLIFIIFIFILKFPIYSQFRLGQEILESVIGDMRDNSISISGDGKTIAVGNYHYGPWAGHILVFKYNGIVWEKLGQNIIGSGSEGLGKTISLSSNGQILAASSFNFTNSVTLFKWNGISWEQFGDQITGFDNNIYSLSLSGDGGRVITGEPYVTNSNLDYIGMVRVFEIQNNQWLELGTGFFGEVNKKIGDKVNISRDGSTIVYGCFNKFTRVKRWDGINWIQLGNDFVSVGLNYTDRAVDLSEDGNRLVRGTLEGYYTPTAFKTYGMVKVHDWNGSIWTQIGNNIFTGSSNFGTTPNSLSISDNGQIIAIGNVTTKSVATFKLSEINDWTQMGQNLTLTESNIYFGENVELSSDGQRLLTSGYEKAGVFQLFTDCSGEGATFTWNGIINNDWGEYQNWNQEEFPSICDDVIIENSGNNPVLDNVNITFRSLYLNPNVTFQVLSNSVVRILNE